jgi:hypothetical protein
MLSSHEFCIMLSSHEFCIMLSSHEFCCIMLSSHEFCCIMLSSHEFCIMLSSHEFSLKSLTRATLNHLIPTSRNHAALGSGGGMSGGNFQALPGR